MARFAFAIDLQPGTEGRYVELHANVWPEVLAETRASGITNYSLFVRGTTVFGYFESEDPALSLASGGEHPGVIRWKALIGELRADDGLMVPLPEVFHLD